MRVRVPRAGGRSARMGCVPDQDPKCGREWDAALYHRLSQPQVTWGKKVLSGLRLRGDEVVMDGGCGTGRLTADLLEALAAGRVVGVDMSENMLTAAREHLRQQFGARVQFVVADLQHLPFEQAFDGIFSTAAFHWVADQKQLFSSLLRALRPGGWLRAQCGGAENLGRLRLRMDQLTAARKFSPYFAGFPNPWVYHDAQAAFALLEQAGFQNVQTNLEPALTVFENARSYYEFVRTVILRLHLKQIPDAMLRKEFVDELTRQASSDDPPFALDYRRLNLSARRPP
jgi:trans-aconitate 2-methyltransferase